METVEAVGGVRSALRASLFLTMTFPTQLGVVPSAAWELKCFPGPCPWTLKRPEGSETCLK